MHRNDSRDLEQRAIDAFPSWELFTAQPQEYRDRVLPPQVTKRLAVEAGVSLGRERWTGSHGAVLAIDHFGASAPYEEIYRQFGLTVDCIVEKARQLITSLY